jgi:short subunit dehydrogenase-like uncharacterized protein
LAAMPLLSRQRGPIAVYGATGYTGRLVVTELADADADFVISGRSRKKLDDLREELNLDIPAQAASVDDPESLRTLLADCSVVIDCAGPFVRLGEPVLRAAVETSTHYLDTTGEQPYIKMAFERYGPGAADAEVAVIPAMGFDYAPGDMLASLTASGMGEVDEVALAYAWRDFTPTHGTARSALEILSRPGVEWRNMEWRSPSGRQRMLRYPAGEQITVPRHVPTRNVTTTMNAAAFSSDRLAPIFAATMGPAGLMLRTPLKRIASAVISRLPEGPTPEQRQRMRWMIVCKVLRGGHERTGVISGADVYGLTAAAVANGGVIAARSGFDGRGALAPSQAFEPKRFLADLERFDVRWQVFEGAPEPVGA